MYASMHSLSRMFPHITANYRFIAMFAVFHLMNPLVRARSMCVLHFTFLIELVHSSCSKNIKLQNSFSFSSSSFSLLCFISLSCFPNTFILSFICLHFIVSHFLTFFISSCQTSWLKRERFRPVFWRCLFRICARKMVVLTDSLLSVETLDTALQHSGTDFYPELPFLFT